MEKLLKGKDLEIGKAVLEWLQNLKAEKTANALSEELQISLAESTKGNLLEKKWNTILTLQKKVIDLETQIKTMKEDFERQAVSGLNGLARKENQSMVSHHRLISIICY